MTPSQPDAVAALMALGAQFQVGDRVLLHVSPKHAGYPGTITEIDTSATWNQCVVMCDKGNLLSLSATLDELELIQ